MEKGIGCSEDGGSVRTLHLPAALSNLLMEHLESTQFNSPEDFVFARADGSPQNPDHLRNNVLYPALRSAGIQPGERTHGFHFFRHSAGSIVHSITAREIANNVLILISDWCLRVETRAPRADISLLFFFRDEPCRLWR